MGIYLGSGFGNLTGNTNNSAPAGGNFKQWIRF